MPTPLGFPTPADSTRLALVFNQMRALANAVDTYLRTHREIGTTPVTFTAANNVTVTVNHSLGVVPSYASAFVHDSTFRGMSCEVAQMTSTYVRFAVFNRTAANVNLTTAIRYRIER